MKNVVLLVVVAVLVVGALNVITVEVPDINAVDGAVAYTQPTVRASFTTSGKSEALRDTSPTAISAATPMIEATPIKYEAPAPVRKSLFQVIFPLGTLTPISGPGTGLTPSQPGVTCSESNVQTSTLKVTTYAKVTILEPGGHNTEMSTPKVTTDVSKRTALTSCSDGQVYTAWSLIGSASYEVGTYYFTNGWGTYAFTVEIYRVGDGVPDEKIGSSQLVVNATEAGSG